MSNEKPKPFAEVREHALGWAIHVDGRQLAYPWNSSVTQKECAEQINAAVEAREAKLRGALRTMIDRVVAITSSHLGDAESLWTPLMARDLLLETAGRATLALADTGPDYVPRAALEAEQAKVKQLQAGLEALDIDYDPHGTAATVMAYLEANGLKAPGKPESWTDGELTRRQSEVNAEMKRRDRLDAETAHVEAAEHCTWRDCREPSISATNRFCGIHSAAHDLVVNALRLADIPRTASRYARAQHYIETRAPRAHTARGLADLLLKSEEM